MATSTLVLTETATPSPTAGVTASATAPSTAEATSTPVNTPVNTSEPIVEPGPEVGASIGLTLPATLQAEAVELRALGVEALFATSQLANTGTVVTTGTVTVDSNGVASYDPTPTDRLRGILADGRIFDFYFGTVQGDFSASAAAFLDGAHDLSLQIIVDPPAAAAGEPSNQPLVSAQAADLKMASTQGNGALLFYTTGQTLSDGKSYNVELTARGTYFFESSGGGLEQRQDYAVTGAISGESLALTVDERYINERVVSGGVSVSTADTENRNRWTYNEDSYAMINGLIRRSFRDGQVSQLDSYWQATGQLRVDGQPIGALGLEIGVAPTVRVLLVLSDRAVELQRFQ